MSLSLNLISDGFGPRRGGAELYIAQLATTAAARGHPVCAYVRRPDQDCDIPGVRVLPLPADWRYGVPMFSGTLLSTLPLPGISHYQPHSGLYMDGFAAEQKSLASGLLRWAYPLGNLLNRRRQQKLRAEKQLLMGEPLPRVMTFSKRVRERLLQHYGLPPEQVLCNPLGVDLLVFYPGRESALDLVPTLPSQALVLLFVAHNFRLKGLPTLLQALAHSLARGLDALLLVVGNGTQIEAKRLAYRYGVTERVLFLGAVAHADMARLYRASDLLIHPTWSDHCSLVVLEALASGLPVITTSYDGAAELIEPGLQGLVLEKPGDTGALANALLQMGDAHRRTDMAAAAAASRSRLDFATHLDHLMEWLTSETGTRSTC